MALYDGVGLTLLSRVGVGVSLIAGGEALTCVVYQLQLDGDREAPRQEGSASEKAPQNGRHYCTDCDRPQQVTGTARQQSPVSNFQFRGFPKQRPNNSRDSAHRRSEGLTVFNMPETRFASKNVFHEAPANVNTGSLEPALSGVTSGLQWKGCVIVYELERKSERRQVQKIRRIADDEADEPREQYETNQKQY
jgi:hypothetical protein